MGEDRASNVAGRHEGTDEAEEPRLSKETIRLRSKARRAAKSREEENNEPPPPEGGSAEDPT